MVLAASTVSDFRTTSTAGDGKTPVGYAPNMRCKSQPTIQQDGFGGYMDVSSSKCDLLASDPR